MNDLLYLDDLRVGDTFKTASHRLDADQVRFFAMHFDPQPFHLDDAAARQSFFGGLAASGWHTAATTMRLLVTSGPPLANGIVGAGAKVEWKAPTRPGDVLRVESEVIEITPSSSRPDRGMVVMRSDTLNQRGEIVQTMTATLVVTRRPARDPESSPPAPHQTEAGTRAVGVLS
ncbi:MaoC family dehydratase [Variovorax guangxiensis]|uniref:MaoC family dehydratase n=1 Tax=Variovorax guangxiensis TaxID=1775474 RepID=UPI002860C75E|nr:MaoC family dehydratase [Variovorax guangxiensis]MDR6858507.1 acyl dehydratase [Variovorax guangxiensis]